ncbi:MFS transporter [Streptomyces sp. NPDC049936]|uniref:MFS transporter n=1 Tax=Streptomyces sp. NPDC049936 TaxID=3365599 RepID=UPI0037B6ABD9
MSKWPISMFPISVLLLAPPRYSYTEAGAVVAVMLLANAVSGPTRGRQATRRGPGPVLRVCLVGYLVGITGIGLCATLGEPLPFLLASALLMGAFFPPASILLRSHWTAVDRDLGHLTSANALESALMDLSLITGPVLAGWLSTSFAAVLPLAVIGALMALAVVLLTALPDRTDHATSVSPVPERAAGILRAPLVMLFAAQFLFCAALAATEVSLPIYAQQRFQASASGWFLAALSTGSMVGALALGLLRGSRLTRLPALLVFLAAGTCGVGAAMSLRPLVVALACVPAGLVVGSIFARFFSVVGTVTPPGTDHEVQGWANSMTTVGFAGGSFGGTALAEAFGMTALLLCAPVLALVAAALSAPAQAQSPS